MKTDRVITPHILNMSFVLYKESVRGGYHHVSAKTSTKLFGRFKRSGSQICHYTHRFHKSLFTEFTDKCRRLNVTTMNFEMIKFEPDTPRKLSIIQDHSCY